MSIGGILSSILSLLWILVIIVTTIIAVGVLLIVFIAAMVMYIDTGTILIGSCMGTVLFLFIVIALLVKLLPPEYVMYATMALSFYIIVDTKPMLKDEMRKLPKKRKIILFSAYLGFASSATYYVFKHVVDFIISNIS